MKTMITLVLAQLAFSATSFAMSPPPPYVPKNFKFNCTITIHSTVGNQQRYESAQNAVAVITSPANGEWYKYNSQIKLDTLNWTTMQTGFKPAPPIDLSNFTAGLSFERNFQDETTVELAVTARQPSDSGRAMVSSYQSAFGKFGPGSSITARTNNEVRLTTESDMKNVDIQMHCLQLN